MFVNKKGEREALFSSNMLPKINMMDRKITLNDYEESDIEWIKFIRRLKETGMLLKDIQLYSDLRYRGKSTMPERLNILQSHTY